MLIRPTWWRRVHLTVTLARRGRADPVPAVRAQRLAAIGVGLLVLAGAVATYAVATYLAATSP